MNPPTDDPTVGWYKSTHIGNKIDRTPFVDIAKKINRKMTSTKDNLEVKNASGTQQIIAMIDNIISVTFDDLKIYSEINGFNKAPKLDPIERPRRALLAFIELYPSISFRKGPPHIPVTL